MAAKKRATKKKSVGKKKSTAKKKAAAAKKPPTKSEILTAIADQTELSRKEVASRARHIQCSRSDENSSEQEACH